MSQAQPPSREELAAMSPQEQLRFLIGRVLDAMRELTERGEDTPFPRYVCFPVPGKDQEARLILAREKRFTGAAPGAMVENWRLSVGVLEKGSTRLHSHFLCHGEDSAGKEKVLAYLHGPEISEKLAASVAELSRHVDMED